MRIDFTDGTYSIEDKDRDTFFVGFNNYLFLRNSCYNCYFTGTKRVADITLADYWGVDLENIPDKQRRYGVSLILTNSKKGKKLINDLKKDMEIYPADRQRAIGANQALERPSSVNKNRNRFFAKFESQDFDTLVKKYEWYRYFQYYRKKIIVGIIGEKNYNKLKVKLGRA